MYETEVLEMWKDVIFVCYYFIFILAKTSWLSEGFQKGIQWSVGYCYLAGNKLFVAESTGSQGSLFGCD